MFKKKDWCTLALTLAALLVVQQALPSPPTASPGGGDPEKGKISVKVSPTKAFVDEAVTITANLSAPDDLETNVAVSFSHANDGQTNPATTAPGGSASVEWDAQMPGGAGPDGGDVQLTAALTSSFQGYYDPWSDAATLRIVAGDVALTVEPKSVEAGESVTLTARIRGGAEDQTIRFTAYYFEIDPATGEGEWELVTGSPWPITRQTDGQGEAEVADTEVPVLKAGKYKYRAWYDGNSDSSGGDDPTPDDDEIDEAEAEGTFELEEIIVAGRNTSNIKTEGEIRFVLPEAITFRAAIEPDNAQVRAISGLFKWELEEIDGITASDISPTLDWGDGERAKGIGFGPPSPSYISFLLTALPADNGGFGEKSVALEVVGHDKGDDATVKLFFNREGDTHPDPGHDTTDNWHYYWSAEGNPAVCEYSRDSGSSDYAEWNGATVNFGAFTGTKIIIYRKAARQNSWSYSFPQNSGAPSHWVRCTISTSNAPDFVNLTFAHERTHRTLAQNGDLDSDNDNVPDSWENAVPGMNPNDSDSFGSQFTLSTGGADRDNEFYSMLGGAVTFGSITPSVTYHGVVPGNANENNDWSSEGPNW